MREIKAQSLLFCILCVLLVYIVLKVHHINSFLSIVIKNSHCIAGWLKNIIATFYLTKKTIIVLNLIRVGVFESLNLIVYAIFIKIKII